MVITSPNDMLETVKPFEMVRDKNFETAMMIMFTNQICGTWVVELQASTLGVLKCVGNKQVDVLLLDIYLE